MGETILDWARVVWLRCRHGGDRMGRFSEGERRSSLPDGIVRVMFTVQAGMVVLLQSMSATSTDC